ncbi:hypothetical protein G3T36_05915 [Diaminobutyricibacter tongyongensis]|uniref:Protein kinase domain-containing protein n=1 Tax=Leifsonia tongyongensis TaxID=1268043 RepID=A0A6L9XVJ4_9MICO|nr:hypothetical protein [Diaminobutyricibacter tongyongensis]NEN05403.1 hypothetical protein [Diaminobutyricibacter tongyongensis]
MPDDEAGAGAGPVVDSRIGATGAGACGTSLRGYGMAGRMGNGTGRGSGCTVAVCSLGLVLLECFTGTVSFPGTPVQSALSRLERDPEIPDAIPERWRELIGWMTQPGASDRPSAADVATAARGALRADRENEAD